IVDLWPIEVANRLACETIIPKVQPFRPLVNELSASVIEFDQNKRRSTVDCMPAAYRVDLSNFSKVLGTESFWFGTKWVHDKSEIQAVAPGECKATRHFLVPHLCLVEGVPEDPCEFQRRVRAQWQFGYDRMMEAAGCQMQR